MSLITYIEPFSVGEVFAGFGILLVCLLFVGLMWRLFKPVIGLVDTLYTRETKYSLIEEKLLGDYAMEKGIDLDKEMIKKNLIRKQRKSMRRRIEDELFRKMFPKESIEVEEDQK